MPNTIRIPRAGVHDPVPLDTRYSSDGTETLLGHYSFEPLTIGTYYLEVDVTHMAPAGVTTTTFEVVDITQAKMYPLDINIPNFMMPTVTSIPITTATTTECLDTDGDLWDDCYEEIVGTNPYIQDTDNDGWIDSLDPNPLLPLTGTTTQSTPTGMLPVLISLGVIVFVMVNRKR